MKAPDLEEALIGACMVEKDAYFDVADMLTSSMFAEAKHKEIWASFERLTAQDKPIDLLTVTQDLRTAGRAEEITPDTLTSLTNKVGSTANIQYHAEIVKQYYLRRWLCAFGDDTQKEAKDSDEDIFSLIEKSEQRLLSSASEAEQSDGVFLSENADNIINKIDALNKGYIDGVSTGLKDLDAVTSGFHNSDLIIIAGRPGMGKTTGMVQFAINVANEGGNVALFSLEMSTDQLHQRLISNLTSFNSAKFRSEGFSAEEQKQIGEALDHPVNKRVILDDKSNMTAFSLRSKCRRWAKRYGLSAIFVDYLQLLNSKSGDNRDQELGHITRACKQIAKELNVPIILYSQLSRQVEQRGGMKRPQLSDLRESGNIEQDADQVIFMWRGEYYRLDEDEDGYSTKNVLKWIVSKNRHGQNKDVPSGIDISTHRIWDLANGNEQQAQSTIQTPF
jgi:replicative DNA helicase